MRIRLERNKSARKMLIGAALVVVFGMVLAGCSSVSLENVLKVGKTAKNKEVDFSAKTVLLAKDQSKWTSLELDLLEKRQDFVASVGIDKPFPNAELGELNLEVTRMEEGLAEWNLRLKVLHDSLGKIEVDLKELMKALDKADIKGAPVWVGDFIKTAKDLCEKKIAYYQSSLALYDAQADEAAKRLDLAKQQVAAFAEMNTTDKVAFDAAVAKYNAAHDAMVKSTAEFKKEEQKLKSARGKAKAEADKLQTELDKITKDSGLKEVFALSK